MRRSYKKRVRKHRVRKHVYTALHQVHASHKGKIAGILGKGRREVDGRSSIPTTINGMLDFAAACSIKFADTLAPRHKLTTLQQALQACRALNI